MFWTVDVCWSLRRDNQQESVVLGVFMDAGCPWGLLYCNTVMVVGKRTMNHDEFGSFE